VRKLRYLHHVSCLNRDHSREEARAFGARVAELERERTAILARTPKPIPDDVLSLHPRAAERYRQKVEDIRAALAKGHKAGGEAVLIVRDMIKKIIVAPTPKGQELPLTIEGDLAVMLDQERDANSCTVPVVPPPRIERGTSRSTI
jgi:hypothetical protein